jgi:hypothetical protein
MPCTSGKKLNNETNPLRFGLTLERVGGTKLWGHVFGFERKATRWSQSSELGDPDYQMCPRW